MMLHQEMVLTWAEQHQATADRIVRYARVDTWKVAIDSKAGPSNAPVTGHDDDEDQLF
jgi:hypothetical protein